VGELGGDLSWFALKILLFKSVDEFNGRDPAVPLSRRPLAVAPNLALATQTSPIAATLLFPSDVTVIQLVAERTLFAHSSHCACRMVKDLFSTTLAI
jgi:hypothetical protein